MLLRAQGPAFCAGYGLDWSTELQAREAADDVLWDSAYDRRMLGTFVDGYLKLWYAAKPTIAAVNGWCIAGGTDMVLCADLIVAGEGAGFGRDFVATAMRAGFRQAVRERDDPFGDYGSRPRH